MSSLPIDYIFENNKCGLRNLVLRFVSPKKIIEQNAQQNMVMNCPEIKPKNCITEITF